MRVKKRISKRVNSRQRNRIQKKVADHHRKSRKLAKKNPQWKSRKPKDLGVPNAFPFKEQVLAEREEVIRRREEERRKKKEERKNGVENGVNGNGNDDEGVEGENGLVRGLQIDSEDEMLDEGEDMSEDEEEEWEEDNDDEDSEEEDSEDEDAQMDDLESSESEWEGIQSEEEEQFSDIDDLTEVNTARNSAKPPYLKAMLRSDLLIFVLDARAPNISRSFELEQWAQKKGKECIFVLNRAELIPPEALQSWTDHLATIYPTFPVLTAESSFSHTLNPSQSFSMLKSTIQETSKAACILGIPSIGKTTLLNALLDKRSRITPTISLRAHKLSPTTEIIDTPAVPPSPHALIPLLLNLKTPQDTIKALINIVAKLPADNYAQLERIYGMPALVRPDPGNRFIDPTKDLLIHVARKFGRLGKSGPNLDGAADIVGEDFRNGKIKWWTLPSVE